LHLEARFLKAGFRDQGQGSEFKNRVWRSKAGSEIKGDWK